IIKNARKQVADKLGVNSEEVYFTSGGTESDNTAIFGSAYSKKRQGNKIITTKVEHPAVLEAMKKLESEGF
ncbi:aminotransferase class V-fold PLP-dependent enzyme, partial [Acinetobacter sp. 163]|nr:aminotransferase class V-fold PLP-dependent enzyme [Acinetobacter sp. 163]